MSQKVFITNLVFLIATLTLPTQKSYSQISISGPSCVVAGTAYIYSISGTYNSSSLMTWCVSNKGIVNQVYGQGSSGNNTCKSATNGVSASITWTAAGNEYVTLQTQNPTGNAPSYAVTIIAALSPGAITTPLSQTIPYNTIPATINCNPATGGACSPTYSYIWQKSPDNVNWSNLSQTTANLTFSSTLLSTTYYRRQVTENSTYSVMYSNSVTKFITPPAMAIPAITPIATQDILTGTAGGILSGPPAIGGSCGGIYNSQWEFSIDGGNTYNNVTNGTGGTSTTYTPGNITQTTTYRRRDMCGSPVIETTYSNEVLVIVHPHLTGGTTTPTAMTITYDTDPEMLTTTWSSGGICTSPAFQWQQSINGGSSYTDIVGAQGQNYDPSNLKVTTYFRRKVTCTEIAYTTPVIITVNPQVFPGSILPATMQIPVNTSPGVLIANAASGGACSNNFVYQWQSSADGITFANITGATLSNYTPGNLSTTTYYRRRVTCGIDILYTNTCKITVASSTSYNYVQVRDITKPGVTDEAAAALLNTLIDVKQTTQYFDGIGRLVQTVAWQANPSKLDMVTPQTYDEFGREIIKYLPYVATTNTGKFKASALSDQYNFNISQYPGEQFYFGKTDYESSPLNVIYTSYAPGLNWTGSNKGVSAKYWSNTPTDAVRKWTVTDVVNSFGNYASTVYTSGGALTKNVTIDENNKQIIEFKDADGKVILKKVQLTATADDGTGRDHSGWLCTYYIYDVYNNLRCVVQPEGVKLLASNGWDITALSGIILNEQCFRYEYDIRNRLVMKKVPGAGEEDMVYDTRDRLIMTQNANLRTAGKWMVTLYDDLNRPIQSGLWVNGQAVAYHGSLAYGVITYPFTTPPGTGWQATTITHYDDYAGLPSGLSSSLVAVNAVNLSSSYNVSPEYAQQIIASTLTRGKPTWTKTNVLAVATQFISGLNLYDDKGMIIQSQSINVTGGLDVVTNQYDFAGKVIRSDVQHQKSGGTSQNYEVATKNTYDDMGRMTKIEKMLNHDGTWKKVSSMTYDALARLQSKGLGVSPINVTNPLESLTYDYNVRGWLLGINRNFVKDAATNYFGFELGYDKTGSIITGASYTNPAFNGNISGTIWKSAGDGEKRKYDFTYDAVNRLQAADFNQFTGGSFNKTALMDFSVSNLQYDGNGNILGQKQMGWKLANSSLIDNLTYNYIPNTNKLKNVVDASSDPATTMGDFRYSSTYNTALGGTKTTAATDYTYDLSGNLTADKNKDITSIIYNYLNLPQTITISGKGSIDYWYDAAGNKLKKIVHETSKPDKTTLYLFGTYQDDVLQFLPQEEGRIRYIPVSGSVPASFQYDYFVEDHLGNVRMVLTEQQQQDIYPATTLEGTYSDINTAIGYEKSFYTINTSNVVDNSFASGITAYANNNTPVANSYPTGNSGNTNVNAMSSKVYKLLATTSGGVNGLNMTLKVMSGDKIDILGKSYYPSNNASGVNYNIPVLDIITTLLGATGGTAAGKGFTATDLNGQTGITNPISSFITDPARGNGTIPKAYVNWILLDENFKFVSGNYSRVGSAGSVKNHFSDPAMQAIPVTKNGYLYVYVSNESPVAVFFDNLQVVHTRGPMLEESHYYPFGLTMSGISSKALNFGDPENNRLFNKGSELQHHEFSDGSGLELYATNFRSLDPQLGRWWQIDPKPDYAQSLYSAMNNNPISINDPLGDTVRGNNNKPVTYSRDKNGNLVWKNATKDIKRIGGSLVNTPDGKKMFDKMMKAKYDVTIKVDTKRSLLIQKLEM